MPKQKKETEEVQMELPLEETCDREEPAPTFTNNAIGMYKDLKDGLWKIVKIPYNLEGQTGTPEVVYATGFRADARESLKINTVRLGIFGDE